VPQVFKYSWQYSEDGSFSCCMISYFVSAALEPSIPFSLGILITNNGYGVAVNLQIASSQPQIIDNAKGLLVNFNITSTQLGNMSTVPSLTVDFGNIDTHTTKGARWIMTCSLSGIFSNYSATFKNTNPLGLLFLNIHI